MTGSFEEDLSGRTVSHYRIVERIGCGGMGVVYRAEDERLGRAVALKFFSSRTFDDADAVERFRREARAASALNHPSICTVHDIGEWEGRPFIVLEYLHGTTLRDSLQAGPLSPDRILDIAIQLSSALATAHDRGIIHRDIKPANVFLTESGQVKILDFGLAKLTEDPLESVSSLPTVSTAAGLTTPGTTMGTVAYMSPEQARGELLDGRTDLFSLGVMLYEMATGVLPFRGRTAAVVFKEILTSSPVEPRDIRPETPDQLSRIIGRLLGKDRDTRYQSAAEVEGELREFQREFESGRFSGTVATRSAEPTHKNRRYFALTGSLVLLIAAVSLVWFFTGLRVVQAPEPKMIAILPFATDGDDTSARRLSHGLASAVIVRLLRMPDLRVASRNTAELFRETTRSSRELAAGTGVSHLLEGSVERQGDRVRISAKLVDLRTDAHIWADSYDRRIADVLAIEDEIALKIAGALELRLAPESRERLEEDPDGVLSAYDYYLMGKSYFDLGLMDEAEQRLLKVKELDPGHFTNPQLLLARIHEATGRFREGAGELEEFLHLHPEAEMAADVAEWRDALRSRGETESPERFETGR